MKQIVNFMTKWRVILSHPRTFPHEVLKTKLHVHFTIPSFLLLGLLVGRSFSSFMFLLCIFISVSFPYLIALVFQGVGKLFGSQAHFNDLLAVPFWGSFIFLLGALFLLPIIPILISLWFIGLSIYILLFVIFMLTILSLVVQVRILKLSSQMTLPKVLAIYLISMAIISGLVYIILSLN